MLLLLLLPLLLALVLVLLSPRMQANSWHSVQLQVFANGSTSALLDGKLLGSIAGGPGDGWRIKVTLSRYIFASMDNFTIAPL